MKLIASPTSPYGRKVRIALAERPIEYVPAKASKRAPSAETAPPAG